MHARRVGILFAVATCSWFPISTAAAPAEDAAGRVQRWLEDIDYFAKELPARQKEFYLLMPRPQFEREVTRLKRDLAQLQDADIILRLSRLVAGLHVAHTLVTVNSGIGAGAFHTYPVRLRWFSDALAVTAAAPEYAHALGCRVVRIGSMTPRQVEKAVAPYASSENDSHFHRVSPRMMSVMELMQRERVVDATGRLKLTCAKADGSEFTLDIAPVRRAGDAPPGSELVDLPDADEDGPPNPGRRLVSAEKALRIPPLFVHKKAKAFYWYEYLPESQVLYIQYNRCHDAPNQTFQQFTDALLAFADSHPVRRVVVDLRFNGGGSSRVFAPLVSGLKARPALSARGRLYALIGPGTFSSAVFAVNDLRGLQAVTVGEPTGNKPNHYGQAGSFVLPNSKLNVHYATKHFHLTRQGDPPAFAPDMPAPLPLADFLAGRDRALEIALGHPAPSRSTRVTTRPQ